METTTDLLAPEGPLLHEASPVMFGEGQDVQQLHVDANNRVCTSTGWLIWQESQQPVEVVRGVLALPLGSLSPYGVAWRFEPAIGTVYVNPYPSASSLPTNGTTNRLRRGAETATPQGSRSKVGSERPRVKVEASTDLEPGRSSGHARSLRKKLAPSTTQQAATDMPTARVQSETGPSAHSANSVTPAEPKRSRVGTLRKKTPVPTPPDTSANASREDGAQVLATASEPPKTSAPKETRNRVGARRKTASEPQPDAARHERNGSRPAHATPPPLTSYDDVKAAVEGTGSSMVIVARGMSARQLAAAKDRDANAGVTRPTAEQAKSQVGEANMGGTVMEFTTNPAVAARFSTWFQDNNKSYFVIVGIESKYLAEGSRSEQGWICDARAPFTILHEREGRRSQSSE